MLPRVLSRVIRPQIIERRLGGVPTEDVHRCVAHGACTVAAPCGRRLAPRLLQAPRARLHVEPVQVVEAAARRAAPEDEHALTDANRAVRPARARTSGIRVDEPRTVLQLYPRLQVVRFEDTRPAQSLHVE
eukprot:816804-Pleurochrysis_carterae.AAC.1